MFALCVLPQIQGGWWKIVRSCWRIKVLLHQQQQQHGERVGECHESWEHSWMHMWGGLDEPESNLVAKILVSMGREAQVMLLMTETWQKASDSRMKLGGFV
jgi:hypothetical protein